MASKSPAFINIVIIQIKPLKTIKIETKLYFEIVLSKIIIIIISIILILFA